MVLGPIIWKARLLCLPISLCQCKHFTKIVFLRHCFFFLLIEPAGSSCACIHSGQPTYTVSALTLYRLCSTPPPPLSLPVSALLAPIRCVSQAASQQQTFGEEKHGLRSHTARLCFARTYRGGTGLYINFRGVVHCLRRAFLPLTPPPICLCGWLTADLMVLSRLV